MTKIKCRKCDSWSLPYDIGKKIRAYETSIYTITKVLETKLIKIKKMIKSKRRNQNNTSHPITNESAASELKQ